MLKFFRIRVPWSRRSGSTSEDRSLPEAESSFLDSDDKPSDEELSSSLDRRTALRALPPGSRWSVPAVYDLNNLPSRTPSRVIPDHDNCLNQFRSPSEVDVFSQPNQGQHASVPTSSVDQGLSSDALVDDPATQAQARLLDPESQAYLRYTVSDHGALQLVPAFSGPGGESTTTMDAVLCP